MTCPHCKHPISDNNLPHEEKCREQHTRKGGPAGPAYKRFPVVA